MSTSDFVVTQPTTVPEFQRLANAFLTGAPVPSGHEVYVVASTAGLRPIQTMVDVADPSAKHKVTTALADKTPQGFTSDEAAARVVYLVVVPDVDRLSVFILSPPIHSITDIQKTAARATGDEPPHNAALGDIASVEVRVKWKSGGASAFHYDHPLDAVFLTRGALESFAYPFYTSVYGTAYLDKLRAKF